MKLFIRYISLSIITIGIILGLIFREQVAYYLSLWLSPVSIVSKVSSSVSEIKSTDNKINVLVLGIDKRREGEIESHLTDSILVASIDRNGEGAVLISIPRDLWIKETKTKINSLYAYSLYQNASIDIEMIKRTVGNIVGLPIHYYAIIDFEAFVEGIDAVGGIVVNVENSFEDYRYPIAGKENAAFESERYETVKFIAGDQLMNGEIALKYARSRHATNIKEAGDFARSRRQQKVILALKDKVFSSKTLSNPKKLVELYNAGSDNIETDFNIINFPVLFNVYKKMKEQSLKRIVLSNEPYDENIVGSGMLMAPSEEDREKLYGGQYVLLPNDYTFNEIHALIRSFVFESNK